MLVEIESFVNWVRRRNPTARTWRDYGYDLAQFVAVVGDHPPTALTFHDVDRFVSQQAARGYQPATINRRLAAVTALYTFLADEDPTLVCPVLPHRHQLRQRQGLPRPVAEADLQRFFAVIHEARERAMFLLMLRCGLRIAEVAQCVCPICTWTKPHHVCWCAARATRNARCISRPRSNARCAAIWPRVPPSPATLCSSATNTPGYPRPPFTNASCRYRAAAGVQLTAHRLRHTFANDLVRADVPVTSIQKLLGHAWLDSTQTYVAANDRQVQADFYAASAQWEASDDHYT